MPRFIYVVNSGDDTVSVNAVDAATGRIRPLGYHPTGPNPRAIVLRTDGRFAYVANAGSGGSGAISAYAIDAASGALAPIDADPTLAGHQDFPAGRDPRGISTLPGFLYAANFGIVPGGLGNVSAWSIDQGNGTLSALPGSPFAAGINPVAIVTSGRYVYVLNDGGDFLLTSRPSITAYSADASTGVLTRIDANPATPAIDDIGTAFRPRSLAVRDDGRALYVANTFGNTITGFDIDAASGVLTRIDADPAVAGFQDFPASPMPVSLAFANGFGYGTSQPGAGGPGRLSIYRAGAGALARIDLDPTTPGVDDLEAGVGPEHATVLTEPQYCGFFFLCSRNLFAYSVNSGSDDISAFITTSFATGTAVPHPELRFPARRAPVAAATLYGAAALTFDSGRVFVAHAESSANIQGVLWSYDMDAASGNLTHVGSADHFGVPGIGGRPTSAAVTPDGRFVYVGATRTSAVHGYSVDPATGTIAKHPASPFFTARNLGGSFDGAGVAVEPTGRFVYLANFSGVFGFAIAAGNLSALSGSPFTTDDRHSIAIDATGRYVFASGRKSIDIFAIDPASGALTAVGGGSLGCCDDWAGGLALDAKRRFAFVGGKGIKVLRIDGVTGSVTDVDADPASPRIDSFANNLRVVSVAVEPEGEFLYAQFAADGVAVFRIDATSGFLSRVDADPATPQIDDLVAHQGRLCVDPNGRYVYIVGLGRLTAYQIDQGSGRLAPVDADPSQAGIQDLPHANNPGAIAFWPRIY